jgi:hypothetical protein
MCGDEARTQTDATWTCVLPDRGAPGPHRRMVSTRLSPACEKRVQRLVPGGRGKGELDTGANHLGFPTVRDPLPAAE